MDDILLVRFFSGRDTTTILTKLCYATTYTKVGSFVTIIKVNVQAFLSFVLYKLHLSPTAPIFSCSLDGGKAKPSCVRLDLHFLIGV